MNQDTAWWQHSVIYTVPTPRVTNQHQVLGYLRDQEKNNPQGSEFNHKGVDTAEMGTTKPFEGPDESQDAKNDQEGVHRHRLQATPRRDNTEITGSERLRNCC